MTNPHCWSRAEDGRHQDYADWLTPERLSAEEVLWARGQLYVRYAAALRTLITQVPDIAHVVELGCGTGWVPTQLDGLGITRYEAIDRNRGCITQAMSKNRERDWVVVLERELRRVAPAADIVCSFAVLKHFTLAELPRLFPQWFRDARYGVFTIPVGPEAKEDGVEHTHTWVDEPLLASMLAAAGHVELSRDLTEPVEPLIVTRRQS